MPNLYVPASLVLHVGTPDQGKRATVPAFRTDQAEE